MDWASSVELAELGSSEVRSRVREDVDADRHTIRRAVGLTYTPKATAVLPGSRCEVFPSEGPTGHVRLASVLGVVPYSTPSLGIRAEAAEPSVRRLVGLDIEQDTSSRPHGFPLAHDPITSVAIVTWDRRYLCRYTTGYHKPEALPDSEGYDVLRLPDSESAAKWALDWIVSEVPDFVAIHNGYSYDVKVLAVHCPASYSRYFKSVNLGKQDRGYDLDVPGVTMVDTYRYPDKLHRGEYSSFSLDHLSTAICGIPKSEQPDLGVRRSWCQDMTDIVYYNIHDAMLHLLLADKSGWITELVSMCSVFRCPISDAARFISGTMVSTMLASYAVSVGKMIDWSEEEWPETKYTGALVLSPTPGLHKGVYVLDVGSMYPSVMIDANISMETVSCTDVGTDSDAGEVDITSQVVTPNTTVDWNSDFVFVTSDGIASKSSLSPIGLAAGALRQLISTRIKVGKRTPTGWALKIGTNSMYGALGARTSKLQSYRAASMTTAIGRFISVLASSVASVLGFKVIYGDTDSVFLTKVSKRYITVGNYLSTLHCILDNTPFVSVRLELEKTYSSLISVKPKMYYGLVHGPNGDLRREIKGLAPVRKDRPKLAQILVDEVCEHICTYGIRNGLPGVTSLVADDDAKVATGFATVEECSMEKRRGGMSYLVHKNDMGNITWLRMDQREAYSGSVSKDWVRSGIRSALDPILAACGMPSARTMSETDLS